MSRVSEGIFECAKEVTKSAKKAPKIQIFAPCVQFIFEGVRSAGMMNLKPSA
jgi:hypothetical protein